MRDARGCEGSGIVGQSIVNSIDNTRLEVPVYDHTPRRLLHRERIAGKIAGEGDNLRQASMRKVTRPSDMTSGARTTGVATDADAAALGVCTRANNASSG